MYRRAMRILTIAPLALLGIAVFITLGAVIVRGLWNWLLPPLFGWHAVTFWQALALLALCRILFGGLGLHGSARSNLRRRIEERMVERWEHMTPEERERFRQGMRRHWWFGPAAGEGEGTTSC